MESWSSGVVESWSHGVVELWSHGVVKSWSHGVMESGSDYITDCVERSHQGDTGQVKGNICRNTLKTIRGSLIESHLWSE